MSDCRSISLHSSVGTTSPEELTDIDKYKEFLQEYSRIKAQHTVLKKAVLKEQAANSSLQEELKEKEHELRTSLQQLDLLTFHNQRLTKRIESLQDSGNTRLAPGWLLGSAKKELEKSKATLEERSTELERKIEENEKLHEELYEMKGLYTQREEMLQAKLSVFEKENGDYRIELTRSRLANDETINIIREEKHNVEIELEQARGDLKWAKALLEENEHKLKDGEDSLRAEMNALRDALSINLGLSDGAHSDGFSIICDKIDSEANEMVESFKRLQSITRDYLKAYKENPQSSYSLGIQMKNASQVWHQNLQKLADKLASAQGRINELANERESLARENEKESKRIAVLEAEISRLKEELQKQRAIKITNPSGPEVNGHNNTTETDGYVADESNSDNDDKSECLEQNFPNLQDIEDSGVNRESAKPENVSCDNSGQLSTDDAFVNLEKPLVMNHDNHLSLSPTTNGGAHETEFIIVNNDLETPSQPQTTAAPAIVGDEIEEDDDDDDDSSVFVYRESSFSDPVKELPALQIASNEPNVDSHSPTSGGEDSIGGSGLPLSIGVLERDTGRFEMSEGDCKREALIKKHYDFKIMQLTEQLQLADSKSVKFYKALKVMQDKLSEADRDKELLSKEIVELKDENLRLKTECEKQVHAMTEFMNNLHMDQDQNREDVGTTSTF